MSADRERGSATAELAAALPVLAVLVIGAVFAVAAITAQLRCVDAAREAALRASRGDGDAVAAAGRLAPPGARISVRQDGSLVRVSVRADVRPLAGLPGIDVGATSTAELEPGAAP